MTRQDLRVDPKALVPGDIIFLQAGARVPADARVIHCTDGCEVDQSALTGEALPVNYILTAQKNIKLSKKYLLNMFQYLHYTREERNIMVATP